MKLVYLITFLLFSVVAFSQQLTYRGNGNISNSMGKTLKTAEVKELFAYNPALLKYYSDAKDKKTIGNILLFGGSGLIVSDLLLGLTSNTTYPTAITYIGLGSLLLAIPIKTGFSKKIKKAVNDHNESLAYHKSTFEINDIALMTNHNGIGIQLKF